MPRLLVACTLVLAIVLPASARAQPRALASAKADRGLPVTGSVVDVQTRIGIPGVRVRLGSSETSPAAFLETVTDAEGRFVFPAVSPGRHRLTVELEGFELLAYPADVVVDDRGSPDPLIVAYPLRMKTDVRTTAVAAAAPENAGAGSVMNGLPGRAIVVAPGGLEDVMRVFQARPGVAASQDDRNDMLVRGGGAIENATRIDGFDLGNPSHFGAQGGSGGGFSFLAPWLIDRAVLRAGGFSAEFGERASSVLDVTLKSGAKDRVHGQAGASVGGLMCEADGTVAGGRGSWLVSARRSFFELVLERGGDRAIPHYADLVGRFDYWLSPRHHLEVLAIGALDNVLVSSTDATNQLRDDQGTALTGVSLRSQWKPLLSTALFVSYSRSTIDAIVDGRGVTDGRDRSIEGEMRVRGEVRQRFGRDGELMAGVAAKRADVSFDLEAKGFRNEFNVYVPALRSRFPYASTDGSVYGEAKLPSAYRLQVTPGVRVDRQRTTDRTYASPRLNVEYRASDAVRFTGAWGVYRQAIPYVWIGSDVRNASLDPVRSQQALGGVAVTLRGGLNLNVEAFDKRYTGYPVDQFEPWRVLVSAASDYDSPFVGLLSSDGRVRARGVDTSATRRLGEHLDVGASYSFWRVSQAALDGVWRRADYDIRHQARLDVAYEVAGRWRAGAQFRYASGRPYTPFDVVLSTRAGWGYYDRTRVNAVAYAPYHRLDVRFDRTFAIGRTSLVLYGEVENLYNRDNVFLYQWVRSTRQTKPLYQWGRLPVAGVRWEF